MERFFYEHSNCNVVFAFHVSADVLGGQQFVLPWENGWCQVFFSFRVDGRSRERRFVCPGERVMVAIMRTCVSLV